MGDDASLILLPFKKANMAWKQFFTLKAGAPTLFIHNGVKLNLQNANCSLHKVKQAYQHGCAHIELTDRGREKFADELGRMKLPKSLPADIASRNITLLAGDDAGKLLLQDQPDQGSGSGAGDEPAEENADLSPEELLVVAEAKGILTRKGTSFLFGELKIGTKAILKNEEVLQQLRAAIT